MNESLKPAYEHREIRYDEPIKGAVIWDSDRNPNPVRGTLLGSYYKEYGRVAIWHPILSDASGKMSPDTPMEEVYVPYHLYRRTLGDLSQLKIKYQELLAQQSGLTEQADPESGELGREEDKTASPSNT